MPQEAAAADQTVRFRGDGPVGRPPLDRVRHAAAGPGGAEPTAAPPDPPPHPTGEARAAEHRSADATPLADGAPRPAPAEPPVQPDGEVDDTRPVTRDWLLGAPEAGETQPAAAAEPGAAVASSSGGTTATGDDSRPGTDDTVAAVAGGPARSVADRSAEPYAGEDDVGTQKFDLTESGHRTAAGPAPVAVTGEHRRSGRDTGNRLGSGQRGYPPPGGDPPPPGSPSSWWQRRAVLGPAAAVAVLAALYGVDLAIAQGAIPRSTVVAGVDIGGLTLSAAASTLERDLSPVVATDRTVVADDVQATVSPTAAGLSLDVDGTVDAADDQPLNPWTRLVTLFSEREVPPVIATEDTALSAQLDTLAAQVDRAPADATIAFEGTTPSVVDPVDGRALDQEGAAEALIGALTSGADPGTPVELPVEITPVRVDRKEAERVLEETVEPAVSAPVTVVSADGATTAEVPVAAIAQSLTFTPEEDGELTVGVGAAALQEALGEELAVFGTPAKDADFQISGGAVTVVPSVDGTGVDPAKLAQQLLPVLTDPAPRSVTAELGPVPAEFTTEEAEALGIKEEISSFTTRFTNPASGTNIRVVAAEVDGALVRPGETFSLNTFTGPRGTAQGYVEAAVIQNGELSKAVGGGISQFATTMFNAVFFAGLEDVYHKPHTFYISRYPAGREATVYEGAIDLQWRNDSDTGVYIDTAWTPGSITVTFYGTKRYEIQAIEGPRTNYRQPTVQDRIDDGNCTPQPGIPGFDVTVTRVFRDLRSGAELKRETFHTRYAAEAIIHCIPPEEAPPPPESATPGE